MPISADDAVNVAREFGLGLPDATALAAMAGNVAEARAIAAQFQPTPATLDESFRAKAEQLAELIARTDTDGRIQPAAEGEPQ